jgi:hypothetical protein
MGAASVADQDEAVCPGPGRCARVLDRPDICEDRATVPLDLVEDTPQLAERGNHDVGAVVGDEIGLISESVVARVSDHANPLLRVVHAWEAAADLVEPGDQIVEGVRVVSRHRFDLLIQAGVLACLRFMRVRDQAPLDRGSR